MLQYDNAVPPQVHHINAPPMWRPDTAWTANHRAPSLHLESPKEAAAARKTARELHGRVETSQDKYEQKVSESRWNSGDS